MTIRPIGSMGWRTVVSGGSVQFMSAESSKPTTDTSPGTRSPRSPRRADRAEGHRVAGADDARDAAASSSRVAAACAASSEYSAVGDVVRAELEARVARPASAAALAACGATARGRAARAAGRSACGRARSRWPIACSSGDRVVARDAREAEAVDARR